MRDLLQGRLRQLHRAVRGRGAPRFRRVAPAPTGLGNGRSAYYATTVPFVCLVAHGPPTCVGLGSNFDIWILVAESLSQVPEVLIKRERIFSQSGLFRFKVPLRRLL